MLDVGRLRVLLAVRAHGGIASAARALSLAPADVADQIGGLERSVGVELVAGEPRGSQLTPAGQRLAGHAERVLGQLEAAESDLASVAGRVDGVLRVGVNAAAGRALLPETLSRLREIAPALDLRLTQVDDSAGLAGLAAGTLDVALVAEYGLVPWRPDPALVRHDLIVEPVLVAVPAPHRIAGSSVRVRQVAEERWVCAPMGSTAAQLLDRACGVSGAQPHVVAHCTDETMALALVAAGHGLALVPATAVDQHTGADRRLDGIRLLTATDPSLRRTVSAVVRRSGATDPAVVRLLDALAATGRHLVNVTPGASRPGPAELGAEPAGTAPAVGPARNGYGRRGGGPERRPLPPVEPPARRSPLEGPVPPAPSELSNSFQSSADLGVRSLPAADLPWHPAPDPAGPTPPADLPPRRPSGSERLGPAAPADLPRRPSPSDLPHRPGSTAVPGQLRPVDSSTGTGPAGPPRRSGERTPPARPPALTDLPSTRSGPPPELPPDSLFRGTTAADPAQRPAAPGARPPAGPSPIQPPRRSRADSRGAAGPGRRGGSDQPPGALPPVPPDDDVRLSIFEELQSEWFSRRSADPLSGPDRPPWESPADDGWRAAARLADPTTAGTTSAGLPRRVPQALYVPGAVTPDSPARDNGAPTRSPQEMRGRLSSYRDGVRRGRHAEGADDQEH